MARLFPNPIWLPFSWLFRLGVAARNFFYKHGLFSIYVPPVPVISIGGLEVGGSGKTPVLLALVRHFQNKGMNTVVISGGYKSSGKGIRLFAPDQTNWQEVGDEAFLVGQKNRIPVVVGRKWCAAKWAIENLKPDLIIADDAFQHRMLARTVDIVVTSNWEILQNERMLPAGHLREPVKNVRRGHLWLLRQRKNPKIPFSIPAFSFLYRLTRARLWPDRQDLNLEELKKKQTFLFAGLGKPRNFEESVRLWGLDIVGSYFIPDHHPYTQSEVDWLVTRGRQAGADFLVTTEKDAVRLEGLKLPDFSLVVLEIECKIEGEELFYRKLEDKLFGRTFV
jgi:tetraacyldisaccharide 4'-kinase